MNPVTDTQALAIVCARIDPAWPADAVERSITAALTAGRTFPDVAAAAIDAASRPELKSPAVIRTHRAAQPAETARVPSQFALCPRCRTPACAGSCSADPDGPAHYRDELSKIRTEKGTTE